jgi:membrane-associated phospholipid phosphatase
LDVAWSMYIGLVFRDYGSVFVVVVAMLFVWDFYAISGRSQRLSEMGYYAAMWISFGVVGTILSYLAAYMRKPLYDVQFAEFDAAIGFYWPRWFEFIRAHTVLDTFLFLAYSSMLPQIFGSILFFAHAKRANRNRELFWMAVIALSITTALSNIFPALGAFYYFNIEIARAVHLPDLIHLLAGTQTSFSLPDMQGLVTFPSYHAAMAIILIYVYRGQRLLFPAIAALNVLMLLSTPTYGGHYLVDIIAGVLIAVFSIFIFQKMTRFKFSGHAAQINGLQVS